MFKEIVSTGVTIWLEMWKNGVMIGMEAHILGMEYLQTQAGQYPVPLKFSVAVHGRQLALNAKPDTAVAQVLQTERQQQPVFVA